MLPFAVTNHGQISEASLIFDNAQAAVRSTGAAAGSSIATGAAGVRVLERRHAGWQVFDGGPALGARIHTPPTARQSVTSSSQTVVLALGFPG